MKDEHELDLALHRIQGQSQASFPWGSVDITLSHINLSAGGRGSPDSLLIVGLVLPLFGERIAVQIPIALEAEKAGMDAAIEDLDKFARRSLQGEPSYLCLPMIVLGERSARKGKPQFRDIRARFDVVEIPMERARSHQA